MKSACRRHLSTLLWIIICENGCFHHLLYITELRERSAFLPHSSSVFWITGCEDACLRHLFFEVGTKCEKCMTPQSVIIFFKNSSKMHAFAIFWAFSELSDKSACLRHLSATFWTTVCEKWMRSPSVDTFRKYVRKVHASGIYSQFMNYCLRKCIPRPSIDHFRN
jgi:hypothetical protein